MDRLVLKDLEMLAHMYRNKLYRGGDGWACGLYYSGSGTLQRLGLVRVEYDDSEYDYCISYQLTAKGKKMGEIAAKELDEAEAAHMADIENRLKKQIKIIEAERERYDAEYARRNSV